MADSESKGNTSSISLLPGVWWLPLAVIAFWGCVEDGCQGALNAQSKALNEAYHAGGWSE